MKARFGWILGIIVLRVVLDPVLLPAQGTAFTYQGQLSNGGAPANGFYDLVFTVYDLPTGNGAFAVCTNTATPISNGLFTVSLNLGFPDIFTGPDRWLEIEVRTNGNGAFATLNPRQKLTPTPYAITAGSVVSGGIGGTYSNPVTFNNAANSFSGNGSSISNVNAVSIGGIGATGFWKATGNAGTTAGPNFLGTTDNQPLELRANGWRGLRLEPVIALDNSRSNVVNVVGGSSVNFVAPGSYAGTIGGGGAGFYFGAPYSNSVLADFGTVGGGQQNSVSGYAGFVGGGYLNAVSDSYSTASGGQGNSSGGLGSTVGGGFANAIQTNALAGTVGGGLLNIIQTNAQASTIGGGTNNTIQPGASESVIAGGSQNMISSGATYTTIAGGGQNTISAGSTYTTIAGGGINIASGLAATVGGGAQNTASAQTSTVGGGGKNIASAEGATVSGGYYNTNSGVYATVGGGNQNLVSGQDATVPGGFLNTAAGRSSFAAGNQAKANHTGAFVWADSQNSAFASAADDQFLVRARGGVQLVTSGAGMTLDGQSVLTTGSSGSGISIQQNSSGGPNVIEGAPGNFVANGVVGATISGGGATNYLSMFNYSNSVTGDFDTVGGGEQNVTAGDFATVGGGVLNTSSGLYATVSGGAANSAYTGSTVGGGQENIAQGVYAIVGGGFGNTAGDAFGNHGDTVGGGQGNVAMGGNATVAGGGLNKATNYSATVPGGLLNVAGAQYSFAAGYLAQALHQGSFVWADSQGTSFSSTTNDQFSIRAGGGVRLNADTSLFCGTTTRQMLNLWGTQYGIGVQSLTTYFRTDSSDPANGFSWFKGGVHNQSPNNPGGGTELMRLTASGITVNSTARIQGVNNWDVSNTEGDFRVGIDAYRFKVGVATNGVGAGDVWMRAHGGTAHIFIKTPGGTTVYSNEGQTSGVSLAANGTAWATISDRNAKKDFAPVNSRELLEKLAAMSITQWHYKWEEDSVTPHIGPMAQDFKAAFYPGSDDKSITTQEADGVALAAIQGLNAKVESENAALVAENAELKTRLERLERLVDSRAERGK